MICRPSLPSISGKTVHFHAAGTNTVCCTVATTSQRSSLVVGTAGGARDMQTIVMEIGLRQYSSMGLVYGLSTTRFTVIITNLLSSGTMAYTSGLCEGCGTVLILARPSSTLMVHASGIISDANTGLTIRR